MVHQVAVILTGKTTATIPVITPGTQSSSPLSSGQTPRLEGMVYIPAGSFRMGSQDGDESEKPVHEVSVKAFFIDQYEVTNQQYQEFMRATGYAAPKYWNDSDYNKPDHPVVGVSWNDAVAYCQWVQKRLPTEEEWEKAARGKNGLQTSAQYPWGDTPPHAGGIFRANYDPGSFSEDGYAKTAPVKSFESGGALWDDGKVYNMVGNVREWTASWFMPYPNSQFKSSRLGQKYYVVRGGSWKDSASYTRVAARDGWSPQSKQPHLGFRCAKDA
jgi:iron(II)-dependent oxidoreductase